MDRERDPDLGLHRVLRRAMEGFDRCLNMTSRQQRRLWRHVESIDSFWESLQEIEPGAIAQVQSQRWLESRGFPLPSVYVVQGSRGPLTSHLEVVHPR